MDTIIAIKGRDFVLIASDSSVSRGIVKIKDEEDKFYEINNVSFVYNGLQSDGFRLCNVAKEKLQFENYESNLKITPKTVSSVIQSMIYESLRESQTDSSCIICNSEEIYVIDKYGAKYTDNFACNGVGASFIYGVMDKHYQNGMSYDETLNLLRKCIFVLKSRFLVNVDTFNVRIVKKTHHENISIKVQ